MDIYDIDKLTIFETTLKKHRENRKTLPWEYQIGCQMCQITLSKSARKEEERHIFLRGWAIFLTTVTTVTAVTTVTSFLNFLSIFGKSNLTHMTIDVMFSGQRFAILTMFQQTILH